jgi:hypothetical protein
MVTQADQPRIAQLLSSYGPETPPQLPLTFGDYLSILWRLDQAAEDPGREGYYRQCALALARGLGIDQRSLGRMVERTPSGSICAMLPNVSYQGTSWLVDAQDRREAIRQLVDMRQHILAMGAYRNSWTLGWPGSRLTDGELREHVFAVLFTAFEGQFSHFSRLLLVIDIVLQELILGKIDYSEVSLARLSQEFHYPDPDSPAAGAYSGH